MKIVATQIVRDRGLQAREKLSQEKVQEYAEILANGETLPAIDVFRDLKNPEKYWLADGWHRDAAAESLGLTERECRVHDGGRPAAFRWALGANAQHGLLRSSADKRRAIQLALEDEEIRRLSDRQIAEIVRVSHPSVSAMRKQLEKISSSDSGQATFDDLREGRDGKVRRMPRRNQATEQTALVSPLLAFAGPLPTNGFDIFDARVNLERLLKEEFKNWPEEKRHAFCVMLRNFTIDNDPEIQTMKRNAFDEVYAKAREQREAAKGGDD